MAEVGLVPFARLALKIASAVLPRYRIRFSKHQFTQGLRASRLERVAFRHGLSLRSIISESDASYMRAKSLFETF